MGRGVDEAYWSGHVIGTGGRVAEYAASLFEQKLKTGRMMGNAMTALGFATGLRPSSLRPLRRHGELAGVKWNESVLLVRRSRTVGDEVMETTKTRGVRADCEVAGRSLGRAGANTTAPAPRLPASERSAATGATERLPRHRLIVAKRITPRESADRSNAV